MAVIAPHWTQFDGARWTRTVPSPSASPTSYTCAGHMCVHISATSRGTRSAMRMWFGWSSRVRLPDAKTLESLSKVSFPSGAGYDADRDVVIRVWSASRSVARSPAR